MAVTLAQLDELFRVLDEAPPLKTMFASAILLPSGKAWRCDTGEHRWHRSQYRAESCAWSAIPMVSVGWRQIGDYP